MSRKLFILLCVMFVVVSCVREQSQDASIKPNIETDKECVVTQDITTEENYIKPSQVIYHKSEPELTNEQMIWLSKYIKKVGLDKKEIWFVRVLSNRLQYLNAYIYFIPDVTSNRTRKGTYILYRHNPQLSSILGEATSKFEAWEYCQVSLWEQPFTSQIEIPPQNSMLPFATPKGFSEQEIVKIVDFIRFEIYYEFYDKHPIYTPILSITRKGEIIKVRTGTVVGELNGLGKYFEIRKTDEGYELIGDILTWIS